MKVQTEECWTGYADSFNFRLTVLTGDYKGKRFTVYASKEKPGWNKGMATTCLDILERELGANRKSIKFDHI